MHRARVGMIVAILGIMAIWGCGQSPAERSANAQRESHLKRLQEDLGTMIKLRDQLNEDLASARAEISRFQSEISQLMAERKSLQEQLTACSAERDAGMVQIDHLRSGLRALLDEAEAGFPATTKAVTGKEPTSAGKG